jgi:hypothetical protein
VIPLNHARGKRITCCRRQKGRLAQGAWLDAKGLQRLLALRLNGLGLKALAYEFSLEALDETISSAAQISSVPHRFFGADGTFRQATATENTTRDIAEIGENALATIRYAIKLASIQPSD